MAPSLPDVPKVSVVIITRNEGTELRATVTNFLETLPADQRELIVLDDGSTDRSAAFLAGMPEVKLLHSDGIGVARARNFGASHATGDVILFSDAHIRAPRGWHSEVVECAASPECRSRGAGDL